MSAPETRALVEQVCADMGLDEFAANTVERWVEDGPDSWPDCCLSDCDPCNAVLKAAAKKVLAKLDPP